MADDLDDIDDQWLYGENPDGIPPDGAPPEDSVDQGVESEKPPGAEEEPPNEPAQKEPAPINHPAEFQDDGPPGVDDLPLPEKENGEIENETEREDGELKQNGDDEDDLDDESDDDINVVIGDIKATASYTQQHSIKRGGLTTTLADKSKQIQQPISKFQVEEFEQIGTINGIPSTDYSLDGLEDKPWRKPGADISDYFNYGFNEDTWKAYCERQKRIRISDSGVGIAALNAIGLPRGPMMMNDANKYPPQNYMQPPPRPMVAPVMKMDAPKINTIQVMTADRREYSRKPGFPDLSVPPPMGYPEPYIPPPEYGFNAEPEPYYGGYEPTQDSQWMEHHGNPNWQPTEIKTLTGSSPPRSMGPPSRRSPARRSPSRERERDRDRERSKSIRPRDDREKSRRRERSRSRSRRHKSRSRSPTHRSHKKKKSSRRHEESD